jgi:hypothetical protein
MLYSVWNRSARHAFNTCTGTPWGLTKALAITFASRMTRITSATGPQPARSVNQVRSPSSQGSQSIDKFLFFRTDFYCRIPSALLSVDLAVPL